MGKVKENLIRSCSLTKSELLPKPPGSLLFTICKFTPSPHERMSYFLIQSTDQASLVCWELPAIGYRREKVGLLPSESLFLTRKKYKDQQKLSGHESTVSLSHSTPKHDLCQTQILKANKLGHTYLYMFSFCALQNLAF